jgi:acetyl-CoA decarbonylase/synthase complex subunit epsilon
VRAQQGGPEQGRPVKPRVAARIILKAERPILVVGGKIASHGGAPLKAAVRLAEAVEMPIIATAHSSKFLDEEGFTNYVEMGLVELTNAASSEDWRGIEGYGRPDLVTAFRAHLDLLNAIFQSLKSFSDIPTLSIDRYFMINANFSLPSLDPPLWLQALEELCGEVEERLAKASP